MDGWVFDEKCIARQSDIKGSHLPLDKIVHFEILQDAVSSVLNGSVCISYFLIPLISAYFEETLWIMNYYWTPIQQVFGVKQLYSFNRLE